MTMAGVNVPGALILGDLASTATVAVGRGGAITIDNTGSPGSVGLLGPVTFATTPSLGTGPLTCGAVTCGAITSSGPLNLGSGSVACGAITSSGPLNLGSGSVACGAITSSGALGLGTNPVVCGAITSSGALGLGTNPVVCGAVTASGDVTWPRNNIAVSFASTASTQAVTSGANTTISWTTKTAGTGITFSSPTTAFTIPVAGWYNLTCGLSFASNATGIRSLWFLVNGATQLAMVSTGGVSGDFTRQGIGLQYQFAAGDTLSVLVFQSSGGSLNVGGDASNATRLEIDRFSN
jgi:hypothetical protein